MHNDSRECSRAEHYSLALTMSGCTAEEFTCADGNCVPMEVRGDRDPLALCLVGMGSMSKGGAELDEGLT